MSMLAHLSMRHDVIVVGAGHAGCEAALAAARLGGARCCSPANLDTIAQMSCNPAVGGVGKGHLVKEIDALGGEMARVTDATGIQFRRLNASQGPGGARDARAVRQGALPRRDAPRRSKRSRGLDLKQDEAARLLVEDGGGRRIAASSTTIGLALPRAAR